MRCVYNCVRVSILLCMCLCAPVFVFLPIVPSVDSLDDVRLHQAGVLLALPSPSGPTCTAEEGQKVGTQK